MTDLSAEDWTRVQKVFDQLVEVPSAARAKWLERRKVEDRIATQAFSLAQAADATGVLDRIGADARATAPPSPPTVRLRPVPGLAPL